MTNKTEQFLIYNIIIFIAERNERIADWKVIKLA